MRILFLAAVDFELDVARAIRTGTDDLFLCGGIGPVATKKAMDAAFAAGGHYDMAVNIGIAGTYTERFRPGIVVHVVREQYGDNPGNLFVNASPPSLFAALPEAVGNTVAALEPRYRRVRADIETMEGAAFFEICLEHGIPFAEIRAVSNYVGESDHARWDIPSALQNLQKSLSPLSH